MVSIGGVNVAVALVAGVIAQGTPFDGKAGLLAGAAACQSNQFALGSIGMQGNGFKGVGTSCQFWPVLPSVA